MKRRKFLRLLGGAALAPLVGKAKPPRPSCDEISEGFGLAPVKPEGSTVLMDPGDLSEASLEEMLIDIVETGERLAIKPMLITPPRHLRWVTQQALEEGLFSGVNATHLGSAEDMTLIEYDYLTDPDDWYLKDERLG